MNKNKPLFELIKSLSRTEKRYFKLQNTNKTSANYMILFEAIDKQDIYDEEKIKKRFAGKGFIKQLHVTKNYLYQQILESLRLYHANISHETRIHALLSEAEVLYRRDLHSHCLQHLLKAEKIALKYENDALLLSILKWQRKLILRTTGAGQGREDLNDLSKRIHLCLGRLKQLTEYWDVTMNFFDIYSGAGPEEFHRKYHSDETEIASHHARVLHYYIGQTLSLVENSPEGAMESTEKLIDYLEGRPEFISDDASSYITAINNKIAVCLRNRNIEMIPPLLNKIRSIPERYGVPARSLSAIKMTIQTYNVELEMYRDTKNISAGLKLTETIQPYISKNIKRIPVTYLLLLYYQFAHVFFLAGDSDNALHWINEIASLPPDPRKEIRKHAELMRLIIHYERKSLTVLKYAIANSRRFLQRREQYGNYEKIILKLFSRLCTLPSAEHKLAFTNAAKDLTSLEDKESLKNELDYLDFMEWIKENERKLS